MVANIAAPPACGLHSAAVRPSAQEASLINTAKHCDEQLLLGSGVIDPNNLAATAHVTFADEFNSLSLWNGVSGTWDTNFWYDPANGNGGTLAGNGEQEWYINALYTPTSSVKPWAVSNGALNITAAPASSAIQPLIDGYKYTSGEVNSYHSFSQQYGYFEMKAQLPAGQGLWPAFWLLPKDGSWPPELDVMEVLGNKMTQLYTTLHSGAANTQAQGSATVADMSQGFHTYGVDWEPDKITWYFDGHQVFQADTPADMNKPMYMVANLAVGGYWPGAVDSTTPFPATMKIDYIRAYASGATTGGVTPPVTPPPVTTPSTGGSTGGTTAGTLVAASSDAGAHLSGGTGSDTLVASHGADTLTGGAGSDTFQFNVLPWSAGHITDFKPGTDVLDLRALFTAAGYHGTNPVADGYLSFASDGHGGTKVYLDIDGSGQANPWPFLITTVDGVAPSSLQASHDWLFSSSGGTTTTSPVTTPSTGGSTGGSSPGTVVAASNDTGTHLTGGAGADTLVASHGPDTLTGGAGGDIFQFNVLPWSAGHISDFKPGTDVLDLKTLLNAAGYHGADPVADGYLSFASDDHGGTRVYLDIDGHGQAYAWPFLITTVDGVTPTDMQSSHGWIF